MKKNKKKLPKFWLGTRMPTSLGYQPNYGIGGYQYTSTPGESISPEINTTRSNTIPSALNKLQTNSSFAINALKDIVKVPTVTAGISTISQPAVTNTIRSGAASYGLAGRIGDTGIRSTINSLNTNAGEEMLKTAAESTAGKAATKSTLGTLGTVTAGIGTLYGGIDMGMQIAANKDHRTAGDMRNTLTTNTYTTDLGNKYTTHGGVDIGNELDYARAQRRKRNLEFTASSIGTGMSAGALVGSLAGSSISPGLGTAIGAGVGALGGLLAYGLGFGDTEEETKAAARRLTDVTSMEDKMSYSLAMNKDAQQGFYGRTKSGSLGAKDGKRPVQSAKGPVNKKATARVSNGELIGNFEDGFVSRVPGIPNNKDTKLAALKPSDFVITNKYGLSDYAAATGDYVGALKAQDILMSDKYMMNGRNTDLLFQAKCGKLPKYGLGTPTDPSKYNPTYGGWGDYILTAMPNMAALYSAWDQYQTDKHMPVEAPNRQIDLSGARNALYRMYGDQIDARPYMNAIDQDTSRAIYRAQRNPGAGYGGRMVLENAITSNAIAEKARQRYAIDQANLQQRNTVNQALAALDQQQQEWENDNFWKSTSLRQAAQAAKYKALAQDKLNLVNPLAQMTKGILDMRQFNVSNALKNRMINIYEKQADRESQEWIDNEVNKRLAEIEDKKSSTNTNSSYKLKPVDLMQIYKGLNNSKLYNTQKTENPFGTKPLTQPTMPYYYGAPRIPIQFNPYFY